MIRVADGDPAGSDSLGLFHRQLVGPHRRPSSPGRRRRRRWPRRGVADDADIRPRIDAARFDQVDVAFIRATPCVSMPRRSATIRMLAAWSASVRGRCRTIRTRGGRIRAGVPGRSDSSRWTLAGVRDGMYSGESARKPIAPRLKSRRRDYREAGGSWTGPARPPAGSRRRGRELQPRCNAAERR